MPRPKTISDEEILRVARRCFQEHGHSVSTRDIARAVGISQSVLYQRFSGKEEMFLRAMMPEPPNIEELLRRPDQLRTNDYLHLITRRLISHFQSLVPALMHLMTYPNFDHSLLEGAHDHLLANTLHEELTVRFRALVEAGEVAARSPEAMATMVISLAHTVGMRSGMLGSTDGSPALSEEFTAVVDVLWRGMEPR